MKRVRLIFIALALVVAGTVAIALYPGSEPRYQGRNLSEILIEAAQAPDLYEGPLYSDAKWQTASNAIQHIGTNAVPVLLKLLSADDSQPKRALMRWLELHPSFPLHLRPAIESKNAALLGLSLLGDKAKAAWPALIQWTFDKNPKRREAGLYCMTRNRTGKETVLPVLLRLIQDPDKGVQKRAAFTLHYYYPKDAEAAGVYKLFPEFKALQTIESNTTDWQPF